MNKAWMRHGKPTHLMSLLSTYSPGVCAIHMQGIILLCMWIWPATGVAGKFSAESNVFRQIETTAPADQSVTSISVFSWVLLEGSAVNESCASSTNCCADIICFGLEYTPGVTGEITTYTTGFFVDCLAGMSPVVSNASCTMQDHSHSIEECSSADSVLFNASGYEGAFPVTAGVPVILHKVCFQLAPGQSIVVTEDEVSDLSLSIDPDGGGHINDFPDYTATTFNRPLPTWPMDVSVSVNCLSQATLPVPPTVLDLCGNSIPATLVDFVDLPDPITCEGMRHYQFEYDDCAGTLHTWNYWYTIEYIPFVTPGDDGETVTCIEDIDVGLVVPPTVYDQCGNQLMAVGPSAPVISGPPCNGTVTYDWVYTDCEGNMASWEYEYTINPDPLVQFGGPVDMDSTITCSLEALPPQVLPVVFNPCGDQLPAPAPTQGGTYAGGCSGTITYTYVYGDCPGEEYVWVYTYTVDCFPLAVRVFLEGAYDVTGDSMFAELNGNHVLPGQDKILSANVAVQLTAPYTPFGQPYNMPPWNHNDNLGMNFGDASSPGAPMGVIPYPMDVVDWVLVTVRENGMLPSDDYWTCAGWVHTSGGVTFPEPCSGLVINPLNSYHVMVQHRNHLGILSDAPVDEVCGGDILEVDFTSMNSYEPIFRIGQKEMLPGVWAMLAANGEQVNTIPAIVSQDRTAWRELQNLLGYSIGDYDLDVSTDSGDETIWKINQNGTSGVIFY
jgi:hypothetical protein